MRLFVTLALALASAADAEGGPFRRCREARPRCRQTLIAPAPACAASPAVAAKAVGLTGAGRPIAVGGCPNGVCPVR